MNNDKHLGAAFTQGLLPVTSLLTIKKIPEKLSGTAVYFVSPPCLGRCYRQAALPVYFLHWRAQFKLVAAKRSQQRFWSYHTPKGALGLYQLPPADSRCPSEHTWLFWWRDLTLLREFVFFTQLFLPERGLPLGKPSVSPRTGGQGTAWTQCLPIGSLRQNTNGCHRYFLCRLLYIGAR